MVTIFKGVRSLMLAALVAQFRLGVLPSIPRVSVNDDGKDGGVEVTMLEMTAKKGKFEVVTYGAESCNSPNPELNKNVCVVHLGLLKISKTTAVIDGYLYFPRDVNITGTVTIDIWKNGGFKPFLRKHVKKACTEGLIGFYVQEYLKSVDGSACLVKKGNYSVKNVDIDNIMKQLAGDQFFYEKILFSLSLDSPNLSPCCCLLNCESKPLRRKAPRAKPKTG